MKLLRPQAVTVANLTASNVVEVPPAAYNAGTTYAEGDQVSLFSGTSNTKADVYTSLINSNTGNDPASSPDEWSDEGVAYLAWDSGTNYLAGAVVTSNRRLYEALQSGSNHSVTDISWWIDLGPDNRWSMFDESVSTTTTRPRIIRVEIDADSRVDSIAMLNVDASSINVTVTDGVTEVYNEDFDMVSDLGITDWFKYYFEPVTRRTDLFVDGLPNVGSPKIIITLTDTDEVSIGNLIMSLSYELGRTAYGAGIGIIDYSRVVRDEFGGGSIVKRGFNRRGRFMVWIESGNVDAVYDILSEYRATPVAVIATQKYTSTYIYGLLKDWEISIDYPHHSVMNIELEGL